MGIFSFLSGEDKPKPKKKDTSQEYIDNAKLEDIENVSDGISPEIVAVIAAAAYVMLTAQNQGISFKISRISNVWAAAGRQKLMDSRSLSQN
jgi:hypothetical protein